MISPGNLLGLAIGAVLVFLLFTTPLGGQPLAVLALCAAGFVVVLIVDIKTGYYGG